MQNTHFKRIIALLLISLFASNLLFGVKAETKNQQPDTIVLTAESCQTSKGVKINNEDFEAGSVIEVEAGARADFAFSAERSGTYIIRLTYSNSDTENTDISLQFLLDGKQLFSDMPSIDFPTIWEDSGNNKKYDESGNQIRNKQKIATNKNKEYAFDPSGKQSNPLELVLTDGDHLFSLFSEIGKACIEKIELIPKQETPDYNEVKATYSKENITNGKNEIIIEAEEGSLRSDRSMQAISDKTSPTVTPSDEVKSLYNAVGGTQWKLAGQWIEWAFDVKNDGLYKIGFHFKQSEKTGDISIREIWLDGEVPFSEADSVRFEYGSMWQFKYFDDENNTPYLFHLSEGKHTIRLKVGLGETAKSIADAMKILEQLNSVYRRIVVITGTSPDIYRDYQLPKLIPDVFSDMKTLHGNLETLKKEFAVKNGGSQTATINRLILQLEQMLEDDDKVATLLSSFQENISAFGTWINGRSEQPLTLDKIVICPPETEDKVSETGFFGLAKHYIVQFLASFVTDYNAIGVVNTDTNKNIKVWMALGRDQSLILKSLINDDFTPQSGIAVNLQLVSATALLPSIVANTAPDVYMGMSQAEPVNLALRGALVNLKKIDGFDKITGRFYSEALVPFEFNGGVYAMPDTMSFPMMFYRKDILKEIGVSISSLTTWDSVLKNVLPELQVNSLSFGIPTEFNSFLTFLYQKGGNVYKNEGKQSTFDSAVAVDSMEFLAKLYTQYGLPLTYSFPNRFRSGEMPVAVADYLQYNQLAVFAPEIKGLWGMLPVPGIKKQDGKIDRSTAATMTGSVILAGSKDVKSAFEYLKWWTSAEVQTAYGSELESVVGAAARYNSANMEAVYSTGWTSDTKQQLSAQIAQLSAIPEVPGGYLTTRYYSFAFRDIAYNGDRVRDTMVDAAEKINAEILHKREEYDLD